MNPAPVRALKAQKESSDLTGPEISAVEHSNQPVKLRVRARNTDSFVI